MHLDALETSILELLRREDVLLAQTDNEHFLIDRESLKKLDGLLRSLMIQNERMRDSLVAVIDRNPPVTRLSLKEARQARDRLDRRLKHLGREVRGELESGVPMKDTLMDRMEMGALGLALPLLDAVVSIAERENKEHPGGKRLRDIDKQG